MCIVWEETVPSSLNILSWIITSSVMVMCMIYQRNWKQECKSDFKRIASVSVTIGRIWVERNWTSAEIKAKGIIFDANDWMGIPEFFEQTSSGQCLSNCTRDTKLWLVTMWNFIWLMYIAYEWFSLNKGNIVASYFPLVTANSKSGFFCFHYFCS